MQMATNMYVHVFIGNIYLLKSNTSFFPSHTILYLSTGPGQAAAQLQLWPRLRAEAEAEPLLVLGQIGSFGRGEGTQPGARRGGDHGVGEGDRGVEGGELAAFPSTSFPRTCDCLPYPLLFPFSMLQQPLLSLTLLFPPPLQLSSLHP